MNSMKRFLIITLMFFTVSVFAQPPVAMLQQAADKMISELREDKELLAKQPRHVDTLVREVLMPHVDMEVVSSAVLREYWNQATPEQQQRFIQLFTQTLIDTYASALVAFNNEQVAFIPLAQGYENQQRIKVDSRIIRQGAPTIPVSYRLLNRNNTWKVYDLIVENVSLIQSYRSQFNGILRSGGMAALLQSMGERSARR